MRLAVVYISLAFAAFADDWPMAFHDPLHSGRTSEIISTPLTFAWSWKDAAPYDNDPKWNKQPFPWLPIYYQGRIYIQGGLNANRLFAIDPASGKTVWEARNPGYTANGNFLFQFANYPGAVAGRILNASTDFTASVDAATGGDMQVVYNTNGGWPSGGTALWNSCAIFQFVETDNGAEDLRVTCDPVKIGQGGTYVIPDRNTTNTDTSFRVPAIADNVVYANRLGQLVAWDPATGRQFWTWGTRNFGSSPAIWNGAVFFYASTRGVLAAVLAASTVTSSGGLAGLPVMWTAPISGAFSPIASDGVVYVGSSDRNFYALDARTGAVKWKRGTGASFTALQIPAISGSLIFIGGADGILYAFDKDTGEEVWRYKVGAPLGPVMIAGGKLVVSDTAFTLYAFTPEKSAVGPAVTGLSVSRVTAGAALTISGTGFTGATSAQLESGPALTGTKVASDSTITASVPSTAQPGRYRVIVTTPTGASAGGPVLEILPAGSFFRSFLGISQGTIDRGTDHSVQRHLARLPDGALVAAYAGRTNGGDIQLTYHISHAGGRTWGAASQFPIENADFSVIWAASFGISAGQGSTIHAIYQQWPSYKQAFAAYTYGGGDQLGIAPKMPVFVSDGPIYAGASAMESGGRIWLAYALGKNVFGAYSSDAGLTWTQT
ncbi:MAG TPA: PQQ-binding-like beta-propeller repeat protein, partial [Candidatus Solibacter sp.]|nr:PQQ-binding-like beta-propeller repeat protein [Candidatus Solibacter sp.]